jgi:hypothetical protein
MTTTVPQQAALEKAVVRVAYFAEFAFASGTLRVCNINQTVTWGGFDWSGLGQLGSISPVEESDGLNSSALNFTLNLAQPSLLAEAAGAVEDYRGKPAKLYMCPLDESYQLIDTPQICWRGTMDMVTLGIDGGSGSIVLKCETASYGLKRRPSLRMNASQQKQKYPTDRGFDYLADLLASPEKWVSILFQQQK